MIPYENRYLLSCANLRAYGADLIRNIASDQSCHACRYAQPKHIARSCEKHAQENRCSGTLVSYSRMQSYVRTDMLDAGLASFRALVEYGAASCYSSVRGLTTSIDRHTHPNLQGSKFLSHPGTCLEWLPAQRRRMTSPQACKPFAI